MWEDVAYYSLKHSPPHDDSLTKVLPQASFDKQGRVYYGNLLARDVIPEDMPGHTFADCRVSDMVQSLSSSLIARAESQPAKGKPIEGAVFRVEDFPAKVSNKIL